MSGLEILAQATRGGDTYLTLDFPPLTSAAYAQVKTALHALDGAWERTLGTHVLYGKREDAQARLDQAIRTGRLPKRNALAFFPTPDRLADTLARHTLSQVGYHPDMGPVRILDPSAGTGALLRAVQLAAPDYDIPAEHLILDACEIDPARAASLQAQGFTLVGTDALRLTGGEYHAVIMNPPFSLPGQPHAALTHVSAALALVRPLGHLSAIIPAPQSPLHLFGDSGYGQLLRDYDYEVELHDPGAFKASGTGVRTAWLSVDLYPHERNLPCSGFSTGWAAAAALVINNNGLIHRTTDLHPNRGAENVRRVIDQIIEQAEREMYSDSYRNHQRPPSYREELTEEILAHVPEHASDLRALLRGAPATVTRPSVPPQPSLF